MKIPVAGPSITAREIALVADAAENAWYESAGAFNAEFETRFAAFAGREFAISLPSCTAAIHLALAALDVGPGDEVIVPESTWIATAAPISYVGATPVFVDVDPYTWCIDVASLTSAITDRTRAVIPVDLYGGMPDYAQIRAVTEPRGIAIVEDAAEAIGSTWCDTPAGGFGVASVFSFHGSKTVTTGEGGMLVTDDAVLKQRVEVLRDHGRGPGAVDFFNDEVAFKYKMSSVQAALGIAQLERVAELVAMKRAIFGWYRNRLGSTPGVTLNDERPGLFNSYWMSTAVFAPETGVTKTALAEHLAARDIATRPFFHPLSAIPAYAHLPGRADAAKRNPVAYELGERGINLPSALRLTDDDVEIVCNAVLSFLATAP
jgi:perosamine synthetase